MFIDAISNVSSWASSLGRLDRESERPTVTDVLELSLSARADRIERQEAPFNQATSIGPLYERLDNLAWISSALNTTGLINNAFSESVATSSDESAVTASVSAGAAAGGGATRGTYEVTVSALAAAQVNTGDSVSTYATTDVKTGKNTLRFTLDGSSTDLSLTVLNGTSNLTVMNDWADEINGAGLGISAEVVSNGTLGTSQLVLSAEASGAANAFTVVDTKGDSASTLGLGNISTTASDASYTVDDVSENSSSNVVYLDNARVALSLHEVTTSSVDITVGADTSGITQSTYSFIESFNALRSHLDDNKQYLNPGLSNALTSFYSAQRYQLAEIGITMDSSGLLEVNTTTFEDAVADDLSKVEAAIGGYKGIATRVGLFADNLHSSPSYQLLEDVNPFESNVNELDLIREEFLNGSIVDLFG